MLAAVGVAQEAALASTLGSAGRKRRRAAPTGSQRLPLSSSPGSLVSSYSATRFRFLTRINPALLTWWQVDFSH